MNADDLMDLKEENERLAREDEQAGSGYNRAMPVHLTFETTMKCNMRCIMCQVHRNPEEARKAGVADSVMPHELFEALARETFPTAKYMSPTVMGEPLLTPYFPRILELLDEYKVKMNIVTSGMLLTRRVSEQIMPYLHKIKVSFDGAKKSIFERIRRGADFERVVSNIKEFTDIRSDFSTEEPPILTFQVTLMRENIEELPSIVEMAHQLGADWVVGLHVFVFDPAFEQQSLLNHKELANRSLMEAEEMGRELGVLTHFPARYRCDDSVAGQIDESSLEEKPRRCKFLWREVWIGHRGDVTPCCVPDRPVMDNLFDKDFREIWNGGLYREMRTRLNSDEPFDCCRRCSMAVQYEPRLGYEYEDDAFLLYE